MLTMQTLRYFSMLFVLCTAVSLANAEERGGPKLEHTKDSLDKVKELVAEKKAILVDVRDPIEWNAGHIQGAVLFPFNDLQGEVDEKLLRSKLPEGTILYTYCAVGFRSLKAGKILLKYKYDVRPLKPGYDELIKAGFKGEKK